MKLSIVTTMYQSANFIIEFYQKISLAAKKITEDYELILVNDGSPDDSLMIAKQIYQTDKRVKIIDLSRNFGHHRAMMTGLGFAKGEYVFLIDCDLEEDPSLLTLFWDELHEDHELDVVYGVQKKRKGGLLERVLGNYFYKFVNFLSEIKITENLLVIRLMKKHYVENLLKHTERELAFVGIAALTGFKQKSLLIDKKSKGSSTYSFSKKINLAINFITSLTNRPLVLIFYFGLIVTLFSILFSIDLIFRKIWLGIGVPGWISVMTSIWLLGGIIIFCLGIIGIYLSKIFMEVKQRPYSIVKNIYSVEESS